MFGLSTAFLLMLLQAAFCFITGHYFLNRSRKFVENSSKAQASVVDKKVTKSSKGASIDLIISFRDQANNEVTTSLHQSLFNFKDYKQGDVIGIIYSNADPKKVDIDGKTGIYSMPTMLFYGGLVLLVLALVREYLI